MRDSVKKQPVGRLDFKQIGETLLSPSDSPLTRFEITRMVESIISSQKPISEIAENLASLPIRDACYIIDDLIAGGLNLDLTFKIRGYAKIHDARLDSIFDFVIARQP